MLLVSLLFVAVIIVSYDRKFLNQQFLKNIGCQRIENYIFKKQNRDLASSYQSFQNLFSKVASNF